MNDDLNSPVLIAELFEGVKFINSCVDGKESVTAEDINALRKLYKLFVFEILGLKQEDSAAGQEELTSSLVNILINLRKEARVRKDFATSDLIRNELSQLGIEVKDTKDGMEWSFK